MVKFSKQLDAQLVPEWRAAYVTYKLLKKDLNVIKDAAIAQPPDETGAPLLHRTDSGRRFSNFTRFQGSFENFVASTGHAVLGLSGRRAHRHSGIIVQVNKVDDEHREKYETVLVEHNDLDAGFFSKLDVQFNKVNHFYRSKEKEFVEHGEALERQMQGLAEMRTALANRQRYPGSAADLCENNPNAMESGRILSAKRSNSPRTRKGHVSNGTASGAGECSTIIKEETQNSPRTRKDRVCRGPGSGAGECSTPCKEETHNSPRTRKDHVSNGIDSEARECSTSYKEETQNSSRTKKAHVSSGTCLGAGVCSTPCKEETQNSPRTKKAHVSSGTCLGAGVCSTPCKEETANSPRTKKAHVSSGTCLGAGVCSNPCKEETPSGPRTKKAHVSSEICLGAGVCSNPCKEETPNSPRTKKAHVSSGTCIGARECSIPSKEETQNSPRTKKAHVSSGTCLEARECSTPCEEETHNSPRTKNANVSSGTCLGAGECSTPYEEETHNSPRTRKGPVSNVIGSESGECSTSSREETWGHRSKSTSPQLTMRMKTPLTTPGATISMLSHTLWEDIVKQVNKTVYSRLDAEKIEEELVVTKKKIKMAEKMLRAAFIEYYRGLGMLKSFSSLNVVAFAKILKKYDKISGKMAASVYLKAIETSYFNTSDKVITLMDEVESMFTKHFASDNHRKAMMHLRPTQRKASHSITFVLGFFTGGGLALLVVFIILAVNTLKWYSSTSANNPYRKTYFETVFPVFSVMALILIHIYAYGIDLYFWRKSRINYPFIFEFQPGTELRHRELLMVAAILTTLLMAAMIGQLTLHLSTGSPVADLIPFFLVLMLALVLFLPFNTCYKSSRTFLLKSMLHVAASPLYKVGLADFFLGDQLTSQTTMLRNIVHMACYYGGGYFKTASISGCSGSRYFKGFVYLISLSPYWWRAMQCARRFFDERKKVHILNGGKYASALAAAAIRIRYGAASTRAWLGMTIVSSATATIYQLYWDLVVDWGLLRRHSKNRWLRDDLILPKHKHIYFTSMVTNTFLRMAWLQSVTRFHFGDPSQHLSDFGFASLEVIRRGQWNFFRLENEHLNNVGNYRATKTVPLPFEKTSTEEDE